MQSNLVRELKLVHLRGERVKGLCHATRVIEEEEGVAIDSGCSKHMTGDASKFTYITYLPLLLFGAAFIAALTVVNLPEPSFATTTLAREAGEEACNNFLSPGFTHVGNPSL